MGVEWESIRGILAFAYGQMSTNIREHTDGTQTWGEHQTGFSEFGPPNNPGKHRPRAIRAIEAATGRRNHRESSVNH
jgi:hypothetical protein